MEEVLGRARRGVGGGGVAAVAVGQEGGPIQISATGKVTPDKAGTPSHPRGVKIDIRGTIDTLGDTAPLMPRSIDVWLPKDWVYNGAKRPTCTLAKLNSGGPRACPPESYMGRVEIALVEDRPSTTPPQAVIFNGGKSKMHIWVLLVNPARVQMAIAGAITKLRSPRWSYRVHADIPSTLQVVSGIPVVMDIFRGRVGRGDWITTTRCPRDHRWRSHLRMTYASGQVVDTDGSVPCRS